MSNFKKFPNSLSLLLATSLIISFSSNSFAQEQAQLKPRSEIENAKSIFIPCNSTIPQEGTAAFTRFALRELTLDAENILSRSQREQGFNAALLRAAERNDRDRFVSLIREAGAYRSDYIGFDPAKTGITLCVGRNLRVCVTINIKITIETTG